MTLIQNEIQLMVTELITGLGMPATQVDIDFPSDRTRGDIATPVALALSKVVGKPPREIAETIAEAARKSQNQYVERVEVAGAGYINIFLSDAYFHDALRRAINEGEHYGANEMFAGKSVLFEYTDPNAFKEFHIGHLMSNTIGEALSRIYAASGAKVTRLCYQSDIGLNVAKAIWGMLQSVTSMPPATAPLAERIAFVGRAYVLGSRQYTDDAEAKIEIDTLNKQLFDKSNARANDLYEKGRAWSLEHFEEIYKLLGTKFDHNYFESDMAGPGLTLVKDGIAKGIFAESEGAVVYKGEDEGLHTRVFVNKFGLPTYEAKELALAHDKAGRFPHDISIVITANEQQEYFKVVLAALKKVNAQAAEKIRHITHGMMRFADGKMSSRAGNIVTGESLVDDMRSTVAERMSNRITDPQARAAVRDAVAVGAVKYSILRQGIGKDIIFDPKQALSLEGDSGPYVQYACVRAGAVVRKAEGIGATAVPEEWATGEISDVDRLVFQFPGIVERAARDCTPHHIVTYLTALASAFNSYYAATPIIGSGAQTSRRLATAQAANIVLRNGMHMIGMIPLDEM
jgi:arginyl-tRNA synthetase